ncbi:MAG: TraB/GumN family protein, partial [Verrucomicrobia bacterium]|nr:TraB/GumN family protein [Verrucomicrobiota bacterium]
MTFGYMRVMCWVGLFLVFVTGAAFAESSVWAVTGSNSTVYLAGSCHVLRGSDYPLPPEFETAYKKSSRLVFEAPLAELETPEVQARI